MMPAGRRPVRAQLSNSGCALPLAGAIACGLFGRALGRANTQFIACAAVGGSFLLSLLAFWATSDPRASLFSTFSAQPTAYAIGHDYGTWFSSGGFRVNFGLRLDHLSGTMALVITGVGFLIHVYSTAYMENDRGFWRYFAYLNLFVGMMLALVLADSLALLFVGWEGVGLCSYLLVGYWYEDPAKAWAGRKAFVANRIGDFGFLIGAFLLVLWVSAFDSQARRNNFLGSPGERWHQGLQQTGPLNFIGLEELALRLPATAQGQPRIQSLDAKIEQGPLAGKTFGQVLTAIMLLMLLGAAGKSAQLPLYVWLPDAMAGPTPVSALIHAATMVTAGVYLFVRISFLLILSPTAMATIAFVGAATALLAALIAFAQNDIKKVLAYSTISQLGMMFMAVGMGVFWAAILHLVTHAFFKACLFLGAGSVMHGNAEETNIKKLGGLRKEMPLTWATFGIATLAITGLVPLSGFFSKDAIIDGIHSTQLKGYAWASNPLWAMGLAIAVCTAFYMTRLYLLTFEGQRAKDAKVPHAHESRWPMTIPLIVLAALSVAGAFYGIPLVKYGNSHQTLMENFLIPVLRSSDRIAQLDGLRETHEAASPWGAWGLGLLAAWIGALPARFLYLKYFPRVAGRPIAPAARRVRRWAENKFYVDELYELIIVKPIKRLSFLLYKIVDTLLIDTVAVRGSAWLIQVAGSGLRRFQTGDTQSYAAVMAIAVAGGVAYALFQVLK